ncbi:MAG TPA: aldo/keto reductase [Acidimicrobiales bacterium]
MQYRAFGQTGVHVSALAFGAMNFGNLGRTSQEDVTAIVGAALEEGINLIDTADTYGRGQSEEMVGRAIASRRDDVVLAAADTVLSAEVLDAIDNVVAPGVDLASQEKMDTPPSLLDVSLRRR